MDPGLNGCESRRVQQFLKRIGEESLEVLVGSESFNEFERRVPFTASTVGRETPDDRVLEVAGCSPSRLLFKERRGERMKFKSSRPLLKHANSERFGANTARPF